MVQQRTTLRYMVLPVYQAKVNTQILVYSRLSMHLAKVNGLSRDTESSACYPNPNPNT